MGRAVEKDWPKRNSDHQLQEAQKMTDRAITPLVEEVCVTAHLAPPGSLQAKQLHLLHAQPSLGQSSHRKKKVLHLYMQGCLSRVQLFGTLWTVVCQASVSEGFSRQEYGSVLANTGCHTLLYFLLPYPPTPLSNWCCQNPYDPNSCTTSTPSPHHSKPKSSRAASGANPSG